MNRDEPDLHDKRRKRHTRAPLLPFCFHPLHPNSGISFDPPSWNFICLPPPPPTPVPLTPFQTAGAHLETIGRIPVNLAYHELCPQPIQDRTPISTVQYPISKWAGGASVFLGGLCERDEISLTEGTEIHGEKRVRRFTFWRPWREGWGVSMSLDIRSQ